MYNIDLIGLAIDLYNELKSRGGYYMTDMTIAPDDPGLRKTFFDEYIAAKKAGDTKIYIPARREKLRLYAVYKSDNDYSFRDIFSLSLQYRIPPKQQVYKPLMEYLNQFDEDGNWIK